MLAAGGAVAAPKQIAQNGAWTVHTEDTGGGKTCFIVSKPTSQAPRELNWDPRFYVMQGATTGGRLEPSVFAGYPFRANSTASVSVGSDTFTLFTDGDSAWIADASDEQRLIEAMKSGATMIVKGTSQRGNVTTDTYSLSGVTAGINRIQQECR